MEIRWYYSVLRRSWPIVVLGLIVPAVVALAVSAALPPVYEARADVALYKSKAEVSLEPQYATLSEDELVRISGADPRRQTLSALAQNPRVLSDTVAALPAELERRWSADKLRRATNVTASGNLLQLTVRDGDPAGAAAAADAWAQTLTATANAVFRRPASADATLTEQLKAAYAEYTAAQSELVAFRGSSQIDELTLAVERGERTTQGLQGAYLGVARATLTSTLIIRTRIPVVLSSAMTLRNRLAAEPASTPLDSAAQVTALFLEAGMLSAGARLPEGVQLAVPAPAAAPATAGEAVQALDGLIAALEDQARQLDDLIVSQSRDLLAAPVIDAELQAGLDRSLADLDRSRAGLEEQQGREQELTMARDLAWEKYTVLARKAAEISIAEQTADTEVVLAAAAVVPDEPVAPQPAANAAIAGGLGLVAALAFVFVRAQLAASPA